MVEPYMASLTYFKNEESLIKAYKEMFDEIDKEYNGDIVEWLNSEVLDIDYLINSQGDLKEACLTVTTGGPHVELCLDGTDRVKMIYIEPLGQEQKFAFTHPKAREVFDYLADYVEEGLLCKY